LSLSRAFGKLIHMATVVPSCRAAGNIL